MQAIPQHVIDYHMRTKGRLPDMLRRQLDMQKALAVSFRSTPNLARENKQTRLFGPFCKTKKKSSIIQRGDYAQFE